MWVSLIGVTLVLGACGDTTDDEVEGGSPAPTSTSTTATGSATGEFVEYCEKSLEIETVPDPDIDFESASEEEVAAAIKQQASDVYLPLAEEIQANAPEKISADIDTLVAAVQELTTSGDFEAVFEEPEVVAAEDRVHTFDLANCGWGQADVVAVDYAFQGVDPSYEAGPVSFEFTNEGGEFHELVLLKKNEDVSESFEDIVAGDRAEAMEKVISIGGAFAEPAGNGYAVADLEAGEYAVVCFVPVGSTLEAVAAAEESGEEPEGGPPHFTQGMLTEFTVE